MSKSPAEDPDVQLGRNLAAAFIATTHGIGLDYARRKYAGEPVGQYWIELARRITSELSMRDAGQERSFTVQ
jgi:hypothetical protein